MSEPTLQDCINYMRSQIKQMEKYPRSYEFNLPYYRKTVELLETRKTDDETFEWCHDCKEYDQKNHCCHRWTKVIRDTVDELEKDRPHGEWKIDSEYGYIFHCVCSKCNTDVMKYISGSENWWLNSVPYFCPNCGADMRKEGAAREE